MATSHSTTTSHATPPPKVVVVEKKKPTVGTVHDDEDKPPKVLVPLRLLMFILAACILGLTGFLLAKHRKLDAPPDIGMTSVTPHASRFQPPSLWLYSHRLQTHRQYQIEASLLVSVIAAAVITMVYAIAAMFVKRSRGGVGSILLILVTLLLAAWWAVNWVLMAIKFREAGRARYFLDRNIPAVHLPVNYTRWNPPIISKRWFAPDIPLDNSTVYLVGSTKNWGLGLIGALYAMSRPVVHRVHHLSGVIMVLAVILWSLIIVALLVMFKRHKQQFSNGSNLMSRAESGQSHATLAKKPEVVVVNKSNEPQHVK